MKKFNKLNGLKKIKTNKKSLIFILPLSLIFLIGITWAFFSNSYAFNNNFNVANYDISIEENFNGTWGTKEVFIVNNDKTPVVLRVSYNEMMRLIQEDGVNIFLSNRVKVENEYVDVVDKKWTETWLNDFEFGNDGWYYYKKVLTEAEGLNERVQLLESIYLNEDTIKLSNNYDDYLKATYELDFNIEAVQADNKAIKELWGYDVTITDNEITWSFN